jgi:PAS domain S-box-containing protein
MAPKRKRIEVKLFEVKRIPEVQAALPLSPEELLTIINSVPAGVAILDRDMRYLQVSDRWCADYSIDSSQVLGRSHYDVFPDVPERWKEMHRRCLEGGTFRAEEDFWDREGGTKKWIRWEIRPWMTRRGIVGGVVILAEDVTHRKLLEEGISEVRQKLIVSQEEERTRIARELHDDIGQRLALLTMKIEELQQDHPGSRLDEVRKETLEIASDVQSLSHELHSSTLDYLGVALAMKSFCREFGEHQKMEVDFRTSDIPSSVPRDISICLFRILQEALHNCAKYSGARRVEVQLRASSEQIDLTVRDLGVGFAGEAAKESVGLGLISMQERVNLVKGKLSIESQPRRGTTILASVPFRIAAISMFQAVWILLMGCPSAVGIT